MKSAYYFLAVVLLALAGLSALSLLLVNVPVAPGGHAPPPRVVFVDLGKLAALHPDTAVLDKMSALAREAGPLPTSTGPLACSPGLRAIGVPDPVKPPEIARPEIEAEIAQSAVGAFNRLDAEQRQALQARLRAIRTTMMESQKPQIAVKVREIEQTAAFKQRSLIGQLGDLRLSTQVNADSLKSGCDMYSRLIPPPYDPNDPNHWIEELCAKAKAKDLELGRINGTLTSETIAIEAEAREKISKLRAEAAADVAARISAIEQAERTKIETEIAAARSEVLPEISSAESAGGFEPTEPAAPKVPARARATVSITPPGGAMPGKEPARAATVKLIASLRARIRSDVAGAVRELASREGYRVTFRPLSGAPDATSAFARLLRRHGPELWGPVLATGPG